MEEHTRMVQERWLHDIHWRCSVLEKVLEQLPIPVTIRTRGDTNVLLKNHAAVVLDRAISPVEPNRDAIPIEGVDDDVEVEMVYDLSPLRNQFVRHLFEADSQGVWVSYPDGSTEYANEKLLKDTGSGPDDLLGWNWRSFIHPDDLSNVAAEWQRCVSGEICYKCQFRCRTGDGAYRWAVFSACPIKNSDRKVVRFIGRLLDVDDDAQLRQQIEDERALFATTLDQLPVSIVVADASEGKVKICNRKTYEIWRYGTPTCSNMYQYKAWIGYHRDGRRYESEDWPLSRSLQHGEVVTNEESLFQRGDGSMGVIRLSSAPVYSDGRLIAGVVCGEDITNQLRAEEQHARLLAAEHAAQATTDLMANVSHELRTPLNCVIGMTELLLEANLPAEQKEYVTTIRESGKLLLTVINDVLDHGKLHAGRVELENIPFELQSLIQTTITLMREQAKLRDVNLRYRFRCPVRVRTPGAEFAAAVAGRATAATAAESPEDDGSAALPVWLRGDPQRLQQIIVNLLSNAIRFTPKHGEVCLTATVGPHTTDADKRPVTIEVSDTGIGIEASTLPRLFQPFTQADSSTTRRYGGTGLGLTICKQLVAMMNGTMHVRSEFGRGSTFWFTVELRQCEEPKTTKHEKSPATYTSHSPTSSTDSVSAAVSRLRMENATAAANPHNLSAASVSRDENNGVVILVAEDNRVNQLLVSRVLQKGGYKDVTVVSNGEEAVRALTERRFDVVLMDCQMPVMDGFEASQHIRRMSDPQKAHIPIIALTASALKADVDRCLAAGMNAHIAKPYDSKTLLGMVSDVVPKESAKGSMEDPHAAP